MVSVSTQTLWTLQLLINIKNCPTPVESDDEHSEDLNVKKSHLEISTLREDSSYSPKQCIVSNMCSDEDRFSDNHSATHGCDNPPIEELYNISTSATRPSGNESELPGRESNAQATNMNKVTTPASACISLQQDSHLDCAICGDTSSGFHCGAYVCEACKKFYTRACKQGITRFKCTNQTRGNSECVINKMTRALCQLCRYNKCVSVGMLPPGHNLIDTTKIADMNCKVCSAPASGFHFGALSCESCKSFFRRMLKRKRAEPVTCQKGGDCIKKPGLRSDCRSCRYQMCIQAGMSADLTRIGRQPNSVRHHRIIENKSVQLKHLPTKALISSNSAESGNSEVAADVSLYLSEFSKTVSSHSNMSASSLECCDLPSSQILDLSLPPGNKSWMCRVEKQKAAYVKLTDSLNKDWASLVVELGEGPVSDYKFISTIFKRFNSFLLLLLDFLKQTEGFSDIDLMDRIVMMKAAIFRTLLLVGSSHYNLQTGKHQTFVFPSHSWISDRYYNLLPEMRQSAKHFDKLGRIIKSLDFNVDELCLMVLLNIMNQENLPKFKSAESVEKLYDSCNNLLTAYLSLKHKEPSQRLSQIRMVMKACSDATYQHSSVAQSVWRNHREYVSCVSDAGYEAIPTLFGEVYSP